MANTASATKRVRQDAKRRLHSRSRRSRVKTAVKNLRNEIHQGNKEEVQKLTPVVQKVIDQAAAAGIYKKNTASRMKSKIMREVNSLN